jgi:ankyrin repeat protein
MMTEHRCIVASQEGHVDAVHVLLDHGAHVNSLDWVSWIPLHFASYEGKSQIQVAQLLFKHASGAKRSQR